MIPPIFISVVLYRHTLDSITHLLSSVLDLCLSYPHLDVTLCVYDASPQDFPSPTSFEISKLIPNVNLLYETGPNVGFGVAHNFNLAPRLESSDSLFLIVNPDVMFSADKLYPLIKWISSRSDISCAAPLILSDDLSIQYTAKHNPTFLSLLLGRFSFLTKIPFLSRYSTFHKNMNFDYTTDFISSPYLSGCFLIVPSFYFAKISGFCSRYFLHLEDADFVRRLSCFGKTFHCPNGVVTHFWSRGSHKSLSQMLHVCKSYFVYVSIWGFRLF